MDGLRRYPLHAIGGALIGALLVSTVRQQLELIVLVAGWFQP